jgi:ubiquinone/menaquinone biosynthesis C-methylase UbiE
VTNPAEAYESYMVPVLFGPWASDLVEAATPRAGERILDLACGTGVVAREAARRLGPVASVTGFDASPSMLAVARSAAARENRKIEWREGRAEALPFPDGAFDLVLCQFGLMFFSDPSAALDESHRVLESGGRLALAIWQGLERHPFYRTLHEVIQRRAGVSALQQIFSWSDTGELSRAIEGAGFRSIDIEPLSKTARFPNPDGFLAGEIAVDTAAIPAMQSLDDRARERIVAAISEDMREPLAAVTRDDHVVIEFHAWIARAVA